MTDPILAIDTDPPAMQTRVSMYPGNEPPAAALDGLATSKYLNFGTLNTGFIVTPGSGPSIIQSMQFSTANDAVGRDPTSWKLWGTNDPITSVEHSAGDAENWSLIAEGPVELPGTLPDGGGDDFRNTLGPLLSFSNSNQYSSYRLIFPTIKNFPAANSMQIADVFMFKDMAGTDPIPLSDFDPVIAVQLEPAIITGLPDSSSPAAETADKLLDGSATYMRGAGTFLTKYLNFGDVNSGFIVTPAVGASIVTSFQMTTADDAMERDPSTWELYGTNDPITSTNHSQGNAESWTLIDSGSVDLPPERQTAGPVVTVENSTTAYKSYRMIFPTLRAAPVMPNSMQLAGIEFFGDLAGGLEGDFNSDGKVDAADYVVWRKTDGAQPGYDMWRTNFGRTAGAGSSLGGSAVPEPGTIGLGLLTLLALGRLRRARRQMT
ncbi:MAG TPA: hypothetical protein VGK58_19720 [Lacipirellulaceae bacterium]